MPICTVVTDPPTPRALHQRTRMTDMPRDRLNVTARVLAFAALLGLAGTFLAGIAIGHHHVLPLRLPALVLFGGFFLAGMAPLLLEVERNSFSLSLTEIPLVVGLLSVPRGPLLLAGALGWILSRVCSPRGAFVKLLFNFPLTFFEMTVAVVVFDSIVDTPTVAGWPTWLALLAGLASAIVLSTTAVNAVILIAGDAITFRQAVRHSMLGVMNVVMSTALTVLSLSALRQSRAAAVPILVLAAVAILPMRRQAKLQRRYDSLQLLHQFTAGLTSSNDLSTTLQSVLAETAKVLRANDAVIVLPRGKDVQHIGLRPESAGVPEQGDSVWREVILEKRPICLARGTTTHNNYLGAHGIKDLMAVPLLHGEDVIGALVVHDRLGDVSTFDGDDLSIFATMANQTTVTLENLRLIDELRSESAEREHQALHDELTGLPNRLFLYRTLDVELARRDCRVAVAVLDLNRFKEVNDTLGHHAGDQVLVEAANRLRRGLPSSSFVARLGGDEFAIVLLGVTGANDATEKIAALQQVFAEPFMLESISLRIDASIGIAISPQHGHDRGGLLKRADVAMYAAKSVRGSAVRSYDPSQDRSSTRTLAIVGALRTAIESDGLDVHFQPKADLVTGRITGAEALARWNHAELGPIPPNDFIPLAEQSGLIDGLTESILRRSLAACAQWDRAGFPIGVAVNVDAQTLLAPGFAGRVLSALVTAGVPANRLTLEITERELVRELDQAADVINALRAERVVFSIDDFGTGYSSLAYLTRLPVDELKIDRSFVADVRLSNQQAAIVRAIADIAVSVGLTTVVEGIEDAETWSVLASLGCAIGQGYYLARAMPSNDFLTWLQVNQRATAPARHSLPLASARG